jgi:glycosidase
MKKTFLQRLRACLKSAAGHRPRPSSSSLALLLAWLVAIPVTGADADLSPQPARQSPAWLKNAVVYEIFTRNFSEEGTFNAITARLDDLQDLGVDVLWLMPIHPSGEKNKKGAIGSPYAVRDFMAVNPDYGTLDDFKRLVKAAHKQKMRVIIDIVANHTAWDSVMMEHPEWYQQNAAGEIAPPNPDWIDVAGLNYDNPDLRRYMINMLKFWVRDAGVDGFRCDVAYMVPTDFWEAAREELQAINPEVIMLAEASQPELLLKAFDMDYSWPLHAALNEVLVHGAPASALRKSWEESRRRFPRGSLHLRISDNHDEARAVARFGIKGALAAQVMMLTLDGVPLFYNGMEVGDATESGAPALFEKLPVYWEPKERPPLRGIYQDLIKLRRQYAAFSNDRVVWLENSQPTDLVTFMRLDARDEFVVLINFSNRPLVGSVKVMHANEFRPVRIPGMPEPAAAGLPLFELGNFEWRIYHRTVAN